MGKILVVDDEPSVLFAFEELLEAEGHTVVTAERAERGLALLDADKFDVVIMDIFMPGMKGLEAIQHIKRDHPRLPVIIMTGQGTMESAIEATRLGAFDYQVKPLEPQQMLHIVEQAMESVRLADRQVDLNPGAPIASHDAIVGQAASMQAIYKSIGRVAATDATVLIRGESGTGKELVARAIYQYSRRANRPMLVVNCAAIPETLLETELFGHERGAFTGANERRIGKFEQADGGTIFLDEIGEIPLSVQAKILRVLQERTFDRVGGHESIRVDVRVLAATNRDLEQAIAKGTFREDLYHRLNVVTIELPPLRERREDIGPLTDYMLDRFSKELGITRPAVAPEARQILQSYAWPGNVRELENCIYRALIFTRGYPIQASAIRNALDHTARDVSAAPAFDEQAMALVVRSYMDSNTGPGAHERMLDLVDRLLITEALNRAQGNQSFASRILGLRRPTLHAKIRKYGIQLPDGAEGGLSGN